MSGRWLVLVYDASFRCQNQQVVRGGLFLGTGQVLFVMTPRLLIARIHAGAGQVISGDLTPSPEVSAPLLCMWALGEGRWLGSGWAPAELSGRSAWFWVSPPWTVSSCRTKVTCETTLDPGSPASPSLLPLSPLPLAFSLFSPGVFKPILKLRPPGKSCNRGKEKRIGAVEKQNVLWS